MTTHGLNIGRLNFGPPFIQTEEISSTAMLGDSLLHFSILCFPAAHVMNMNNFSDTLHQLTVCKS